MSIPHREGLVNDSERGRICPTCNAPISSCRCPKGKKRTGKVPSPHVSCPRDGVVRIMRQTKGRKGKGVTLINGIALPPIELKALAKKLKQACGTGGTIRDGVIEIQGDHRDRLLTLLEKMGFQAKKAGG